MRDETCHSYISDNIGRYVVSNMKVNSKHREGEESQWLAVGVAQTKENTKKCRMPQSSVWLAAFIVVLAVPSASEETAGFQVSIGRMTI